MEKLAIYGGKPVRRPIRVLPLIGREEIKAAIKVLQSKILSCFRGGIYTHEFERNFSKLVKTKYAVATTSGTAALYLAAASQGIGPGDEVIVPNFTFVSTASVVLMQNATPIFADIDRKNFTISTDSIINNISKQTKAIMPVHLFGFPAEMKKIIKIANETGLRVIEDAAQAPGAKIGKKFTGSFGDCGCFSFFQTKNMTTGEGGMVTTNKLQTKKRACLVRDVGSPPNTKTWYNYTDLGFNLNLTELQAAIGIQQLKKLSRFNNFRIRNSKLYRKRLKNLGLQFIEEREGIKNVYHNFPILLPLDLAKKRDWIVSAIRSEGGTVDTCYPKTLSSTPLFQYKKAYDNNCPYSCRHFKKSINYKVVNTPNADEISKKIFNCYTDPALKRTDIEFTCEAIKKVLRNV